jgi:hypothetical protein
MKSCLPPVAQLAIGRSQLSRSLGRDQTNDDIGPMLMLEFRREHHSRTHFRNVSAEKRANHDVTWLQRFSRSCSSNRLREAAVASARSSSDQESDHSMTRSRPSSASCCAQPSTFLASSGGSARTTLISDSSLALRIILFVIVCLPVSRPRCRVGLTPKSSLARECSPDPAAASPPSSSPNPPPNIAA